MTVSASHIERFRASYATDPDGCLIWTEGKARGGYGKFSADYKTWLAHRWIFLWYHGWLPPVVMHHCDKPACVRISCLMPGTNAENAADKVHKGRQARGVRHGCAKLTESQVVEIRKAYNGTVTQQALADRYGVTQTAISLIVTGKKWQALL